MKNKFISMLCLTALLAFVMTASAFASWCYMCGDGAKGSYTLIGNTGHTFTCDQCGYETSNSCKFDVSYDDNEHFQKCECGRTVNRASHNIILQNLGNGYHMYLCKECGYCYGMTKHTYTSWTHDGDYCSRQCTVCDYSGGHSTKVYKWNAAKDACQGWCRECSESVTKPHTCNSWQPGGDTCQGKCERCSRQLSKEHVPKLVGDKDGHKQVCTDCGAELSATAHTFEYIIEGAEHWQKCSTCGYTTERVACEYTWTSDGNLCRGVCVCGNSTNHGTTSNSWIPVEGGCQGTCIICEETIIKSHNESTKSYSYDQNGHTRKCADCGAKLTEAEPHDLEYRYNDTEHCRVCRACNYETNHVAHEYTWVADGTQCKGTCVCGNSTAHELALSDWQPDESGSCCVKKCETCNRIVMTQAHTISSEYNCDEEDHWKKCENCGYVMTEPTGHCYDAVDQGDGTHQMTCECGYTLSDPKEHSYNCYDQGDGTHMLECVCGATTGEAEKHTDFEWVDIDGEHYYCCVDCEYIDESKTHKAGKGQSFKCTLESCKEEEHTHSYRNWKYKGEGKHKAVCSCGDKSKTADCVYVSFTLNDITYEICPVCGNIRNVVLDEAGNITESTDAEVTVTRVWNVKTDFADEKIDARIDVLIIELEDGTKLLSIGFDKSGTLVQADEEEPKTYTFSVKLPKETLTEGAKLVADDETVVATAEENGSAMFMLTLTEELDAQFVIEDGQAKG